MTAGGRTQSIEALIGGIGNFPGAGIDGRVLAAALWGAFFGLMKKEIPTLKVRDLVDDQGNIRQEITFGPTSEPMPLPPDAGDFFRDHVSYLRTKNQAGPDDKVFPGYNNERTLQRHFSKALSSLSLPIPANRIFTMVRQEGVKKTYESLKNQFGQIRAVVDTGRQFRISPKEVRDILESTIRRSISPSTVNDLPPEMCIIDALKKCALSGILYKEKAGGNEGESSFEEISSNIATMMREKDYPNGSSVDNDICNLILDEFEEKLIAGFEKEVDKICSSNKGKSIEATVREKTEDFDNFVDDDPTFPQDRKETLKAKLRFFGEKASLESRMSKDIGRVSGNDLSLFFGLVDQCGFLDDAGKARTKDQIQRLMEYHQLLAFYRQISITAKASQLGTLNSDFHGAVDQSQYLDQNQKNECKDAFSKLIQERLKAPRSPMGKLDQNKLWFIASTFGDPDLQKLLQKYLLRF